VFGINTAERIAFFSTCSQQEYPSGCCCGRWKLVGSIRPHSPALYASRTGRHVSRNRPFHQWHSVAGPVISLHKHFCKASLYTLIPISSRQHRYTSSTYAKSVLLHTTLISAQRSDLQATFRMLSAMQTQKAVMSGSSALQASRSGLIALPRTSVRYAGPSVGGAPCLTVSPARGSLDRWFACSTASYDRAFLATPRCGRDPC
jgi:hypothetical protein